MSESYEGSMEDDSPGGKYWPSKNACVNCVRLTRERDAARVALRRLIAKAKGVGLYEGTDDQLRPSDVRLKVLEGKP
jgi:hypothetical protein